MTAYVIILYKYILVASFNGFNCLRLCFSIAILFDESSTVRIGNRQLLILMIRQSGPQGVIWRGLRLLDICPDDIVSKCSYLKHAHFLNALFQLEHTY